MSTIKINELASSAISLSDFFAKADVNGIANKNTVQGLSNFLNTTGTLAYRGVLLAADAAVTLDGIYVAGNDGTYTNNGGLVITISNQIVLISITGTQTVFEKVEIPVSIVKDATPTVGSTNPVESGGVYDDYKYNSLIDVVNGLTSYVDYNTTTKIVTIPNQTTIAVNEGDACLFINGERTVDITPIGSSLVKICYDTVLDTFTARLYSQALNANEKLFCIVRNSSSVTDLLIKCRYTINDSYANSYGSISNGLEVSFGTDSACLLEEGFGNNSTDKVYFRGSSLFLRGSLNITYSFTQLLAGTGQDGSLVFETSPNGFTNCISISHQKSLVFDFEDKLLKIVGQTSIKDSHFVIFKVLNGKIEDGNLIGWKLNRVQDTYSNVSLIYSIEGDLPDVNTQTETLDLGDDPILVIENTSYRFKNIYPSNPEIYREIDLTVTNNGTSARKLYFNISTKLFENFAFDSNPTKKELVLIGSIRKENVEGGLLCSFPFYNTMNGGFYSAVNNKSFNVDSNIIISSHRGYYAYGSSPENSIDSIVSASKHGYKYCEFDVMPTLDDELVVMHDDSINRTMKNFPAYTNIIGTVNVHQNNLIDLRTDYILASTFIKQRRQIPTLSEYLKKLKSYNIYPIIEVKGSNWSNSNLDTLISTADKIIGKGNYSCISFTNSFLEYIRSIDSDVKLGFLQDNGIPYLITNAPSFFIKPYASATALEAESYLTAGIEYWAYTVPNNSYDSMIKIGVNGILTDVIAPSLANQTPAQLIQTDQNSYNEFYTTGTITSELLSLGIGEKVQNKNPIKRYKQGALFVEIELNGRAQLLTEAVNLELNSGGERETFTFQPTFLNDMPNFTLTALDSSDVYSIKYVIFQF